jgi:CheY-like chemotaxis protein
MTDPTDTGSREAQGLQHSIPEMLADGSSSARRHQKLLVVEDNPEMQKLLHYFLSPRWEVFAAFDLDAAIELALARSFDAVLMDINLGEGTTGVEVLRAIRQIPQNALTPVVAVTAYALPGDRERFLAEGFDGYIGKPFARQQLEGVIESVIAA